MMKDFQTLRTVTNKKGIKQVLILSILFSYFNAHSQIAANYEVATWYKFKTAAVSYTFDDNCPKQLPVALPLFNRYNFKVTFFTVVNWGPNWASLSAASQNGHEVASHTMSHPQSLATLNDASQESELKESQANIRSRVSGAQCLTIAYPNCNTGKISLLQKYYIAGRICSNSIIPSSPTDFYNLSSLITGSSGVVKTAADFNSRVESAKSSKGWCVFLTHGIDDDGGYSPTPSSALSSHLDYVHARPTEFWVETFGNVVKYIKERTSVSISEKAITNDSLEVSVTDKEDNAVYSLPLSIRRALPASWQNAKVYLNNKQIASSMVTVNGKKFIEFEVVPDQGKVYLSSGNSVVTSIQEEMGETFAPLLEPNPFVDGMTLHSPGSFYFEVYSLEGRLVEAGQAENVAYIGAHVSPGIYFLKLTQGVGITTYRIVKK